MGTQIQVTSKATAVGGVRVGDVILPERFELHWTFTGEDYGDPELHAVFEVIDGIPQCREFKVVSPEGGRKLIGADFRDIRIDDLLEIAAAHAAKPLPITNDGINTTTISHSPDDVDRAIKSVRRATRAGRRKGPTDAQLLKVAELYRDNPKAPTKAVEEHFGIAHRTASLWGQRARDKGFMPSDDNRKGVSE